MRLGTYFAAAAAVVAVTVGVSACGTADVTCGDGVQCVEVEREGVSCDFADANGTPVASVDDGTDTFYFVVRNFDLRPQGTCGGREGCGHARIYVEGCEVAAETHGNTTRLDVSQCGAGEHRVILVLHDDDHAVYADGGAAIFAVVTVNVTEAAYASRGHDSDKDSDSDCDTDSDKDSDKDSDSK